MPSYAVVFALADPSVTNNNVAICYDTCNPDSSGSNTGTGMQSGQDLMRGDANICCSGTSTTQGFNVLLRGPVMTTSPCTLCK